MAYTPVSKTVPQYHVSGSPASGYFLKGYETGGTTAKSMATDTGGGTTLAKCQLNAQGYPINGSSDVFIPHFQGSYKLALYTNATDADANTTANATWVVDSIPGDLVPNTSRYELGSEAAAASHPGISTGHVIHTNYHDTNRVIGSGGSLRFTGTTIAGNAGNWPHTDGYFYDADGKQFAWIGQPNILGFGAQGSNQTEDTAAFVAAIAYLASTTPVGGEILVPSGSYDVTGGSIVLSNDIHIVGEGPLSTRINHKGSGNGITVGTTSTHTWRVGVRNLQLAGETTTASNNLYAYNHENCVFEGLWLDAGTSAPSSGGGTCITTEVPDQSPSAAEHAQFNVFRDIRCAPGGGRSIRIACSSEVVNDVAAYNTSGYWSNISAVGHGANAEEYLLSVDSESSSHMFSDCYFEPSNVAVVGVLINGKNVQMVNCFIDGHADQTVLEVGDNATDFKFIGNLDGDVTYPTATTANAMFMTNSGNNGFQLFAHDLNMYKPSGGTQEFKMHAGTSGNFGFTIRHDGANNRFLMIAVENGTEREVWRIERSTGNIGFRGSAAIAKPAIQGSRGGNAALANLLTGLANYGLITDSTT